MLLLLRCVFNHFSRFREIFSFWSRGLLLRLHSTFSFLRNSLNLHICIGTLQLSFSTWAISKLRYQRLLSLYTSICHLISEAGVRQGNLFVNKTCLFMEFHLRASRADYHFAAISILRGFNVYSFTLVYADWKAAARSSERKRKKFSPTIPSKFIFNQVSTKAARRSMVSIRIYCQLLLHMLSESTHNFSSTYAGKRMNALLEINFPTMSTSITTTAWNYNLIWCKVAKHKIFKLNFNAFLVVSLCLGRIAAKADERNGHCAMLHKTCFIMPSHLTFTEPFKCFNSGLRVD